MTTNPMNANGNIPIAIEPGWEDATFIKDPSMPDLWMRLLFYSDTDVRFDHRCDRGKRGIIYCAPRLTDVNQPGGHQVTGARGCPTVRASIVCEDCGTHGFITEGRWQRPNRAPRIGQQSQE